MSQRSENVPVKEHRFAEILRLQQLPLRMTERKETPVVVTQTLSDKVARGFTEAYRDCLSAGISSVGVLALNLSRRDENRADLSLDK